MESFFRISVVLLLILLFLLFIWGFKRLRELLQKKAERPCPAPNVKVDRVVAPSVRDQLIVWRKPNVSDAAFNQWKAGLLNELPGVAVKKICESCDANLELWEGNNVTTVITGKTLGSSGGGNGDLSGGGDDVASFSLNFIMNLPEPAPYVCGTRRVSPTEPSAPLPGTPLTVAVFDSGLLDDLKTFYTKEVPDSCMQGGKAGWNFADKNNLTNDNHEHIHGSTVTQFIKDQETKYRLQAINILPVKTHNSEGKGDLFSILCGFAYAVNCGAKIINASFGFYSAINSGPPEILVEFVTRVLRKNNILLIAAAGNTNADKTVGKSPATDIRDLNTNPFFPACLSKDFPNVLTVTTVSPTHDTVSPSQNYSNIFVDIGVVCDEPDSAGDYRFKDPFHSSSAIIGSSYATPIVTGKIAQHYKDLMLGMENGIDKDKLLDNMKQKGLLAINEQLKEYVKYGHWTEKGI